MVRAPREDVCALGSRSCLVGVPAPSAAVVLGGCAGPRPLRTTTSDTLGTWGLKLC